MGDDQEQYLRMSSSGEDDSFWDAQSEGETSTAIKFVPLKGVMQHDVSALTNSMREQMLQREESLASVSGAEVSGNEAPNQYEKQQKKALSAFINNHRDRPSDGTTTLTQNSSMELRSQRRGYRFLAGSTTSGDGATTTDGDEPTTTDGDEPTTTSEDASSSSQYEDTSQDVYEDEYEAQSGHRSMKKLTVKDTPPCSRRYADWLICGCMGILTVIVFAVVFAIVDNQNKSPTMPPTQFRGTQAEVFDLIVREFPLAEDALSDPTTPQYEALGTVSRALSDRSIEMENKLAIFQQYSLATLFYSTSSNGFSWKRSDGWLTYSDECAWLGVECNGDGEVIGLNMTDNALRGPLPIDLSLLSNKLATLQLSGNQLVGSLPFELQSLSMLQTLDLANNALTGRIPLDEFSSMSSLVSLILGSNQLTSTLPTDILRLTSLRVLDLGNNLLVGSVPLMVGGLRGLQTLNMSANSFSGSLPDELDRLTELRQLDISGNRFTGFPLSLTGLTTLELLNVASNELTSLPFEAMVVLQSLRLLDVSSNKLDSSSGLSVLGNLNLLTSLRLADNGLTNDGSESPCESFGQLQNLEELDLSSNKFEGKCDYFWLFDSIRRLDLTGNSFSGTLPSLLSSLTNLTELSVGDNSFTGPIPSEAGLLTSLEVLSLARNSFSGTLSEELGKLTSLKRLEISYSAMTGSIPLSLGSISTLEVVDLGQNAFSGSIPAQLFNNQWLQYLDLNSNYFTGSLPSEIGLLSLVTTFDLSGNLGLAGTLPNEIMFMTDLTVLQVQASDLSGTIPSGIGLLTNMAELVLSASQFSGEIPTEMFLLTKLSSLIIGSPFLDGALGSEIGALTNLQELSIGAPGLTGTLPDEISHLTRLADLDITGLQGPIQPTFGQLTRLASLVFSDFDFAGPLPDEFSKLTLLRTFDASRCNFPEIPATIGDLKLLRNLHVSESGVESSIPTEIGTLAHLVSLNLSDNELTGSIPSEIGLLTLLTGVVLNGNKLNGEVPSELYSLPRLGLLNAENNDLTGSVQSTLCEQQLALVFVDCLEVDCPCCECERLEVSLDGSPMIPTLSPIAAELEMVLDGSPSNQTAAEVETVLDTIPTLSPTAVTAAAYECDSFQSISSSGIALNMDDSDSEYHEVALPFSFTWPSGESFDNAWISSNGYIFLNETFDAHQAFHPLKALYYAPPPFPFIAPCGSNLNSSPNDIVYVASETDSFTVSWENVRFSTDIFIHLWFQVVLYLDGSIEFRYGQGDLASIAPILATIRDDKSGILEIPVGSAFDPAGTLVTWPEDQCRRFNPDGPNFAQFVPPNGY